MENNLWSRRSSNNNSKLSLSTNSANNGASADYPRSFAGGKRQGGDTPSHTKANPFNSMSPGGAITSPTIGASSAFGLGSGAFASFGSSTKTPKSPANTLDFGNIAGRASTEKERKDSGPVRSVAPRGDVPLAENKLVKSQSSHTTKNSWVFWYRPPISKANGYVDYEKTLHAIAGFDTLEDFFEIYKHLQRPSDLPLVSDYHVFKKGIRPVWEDDENKKGGKWVIRLRKGVADRYWEELLFAMIGDQFAEASEEVCGAVLSVRNGEDILNIWVRNDGGRVLKIRETVKRILAFPPDTKVEWKSHDASIAQRTAIDDARKEKNANHHHHHHHHHNSEKRNGNKQDDSEKKQNS